MLFYFKKYIQETAPAITAGSLLGLACGAVAGVAGLHQMCTGYPGNMALDDCNSLEPFINPDSQRAAAVAGALAGSAIGFVTGAVVYPLYSGFVSACRQNIQQRQQIEAEQENLEIERP